MPSPSPLGALLRRARSLRRRRICFDPSLELLPRPVRTGDTEEGSPLFDWSEPVRFRVRGGWPEGRVLEVGLLRAAGASRCWLELSAGGCEAAASVPEGEWLKLRIEPPAGPHEAGRVFTLTVESEPAGTVALGELHLVDDDTSSVERNLWRQRAEIDRGAIRLDSLPSELTVETTSACNLKCVMCEHATTRMARPKHLSDPLLDALTPALRTAREIQLHVLGEPLLSPAFWKALERTRGQLHSTIGINTNLTVLGEERIERILDSSLTYLNVSLDAATPETFRKIRGADLEPVLANARALVAARDARGRERPRLYFNMTLMRENLHEAPDFVSLARELGGDRAYLWPMNEGRDWTVERDGFVFDYASQHPSLEPARSNRMLGLAIERAEKEGIELCLDHNRVLFFDEPAAEADPSAAPARAGEPPASPGECTYPWRWLLVRSDGLAQPCCFIQETVGDLSRQSLYEVWNGPKLQEIRRSLARDELPRPCHGAACKYAVGTRRPG